MWCQSSKSVLVSFAAVSALIVSLIGPFAGPASASVADDSASRMVSPAPYLNSDGSFNMIGDFYGSFDLTGFNVVLDNYMGPVLSPKSQPSTVAADTWSALTDNGLDNIVNALAVIGTDLYVGGTFSRTFGGPTTGLNRIAKYATSTGTWSALTDNGLSNTVNVLTVIGTDLYVGGLFTQTFGGATTGLNRIAKYATSTGTWSALTDNGLDSAVNVLTVIGTDLYVGGGFLRKPLPQQQRD